MLRHAKSFSEIISDLAITPGSTGDIDLTVFDHPNIKSPLLFDIAWEVARKVGGIYTVLSSKAPVTIKEYGDSYALVGPYVHDSAVTEYEPVMPSALTQSVLKEVESKHGIKVYFGRWLVQGYPRVFLIDINSSMHNLSTWRHELMAGFESFDDREVNESVVFGYQVSVLLETFVKAVSTRPIIAHFHEWLAGVGLTVLRTRQIKIATIFTTHATLLGRYLAAAGADLYYKMEEFKPDYEAGRRLIYPKHWIERSAAHSATVFTTVSEITAYEAKHLLQKEADLILPNGLTITKFVALHEFQNLHKRFKDVLNEFVRGHFYGHYDFDLDKTLYFFTAGRYEFRNKGIDLYLEALAQLNQRLKNEGSKTTVVAFIITPSPSNNFNVESLKGQSLVRDLRETCAQVVKNIADRLLEATLRGRQVSEEQLLTTEDQVMLKRRIFAIKQRSSLPPIVTHNMANENDEILHNLRRLQLFNSPADRVKIIYHPEFLSSTNPLIPLDYTDFVRGCHLGVFPSYYEPWGYTPAECTIMGTPSISSNLTGFANFMSKHVIDPESHGIFVVDRRFKPPHESIEQLAHIMWRFTQLDRRARIELRNRTERLSELLDWDNLGQSYSNARDLALERTYS